jgi:LPXTG-motif cell wall-anchored protein
MSDNKLSDLTGLAPLANLEALMLDSNGIKDISILSKFSKLTMLSLQGNQIKDITPLAGLDIGFLNIGYNEIEDISSLLALKNLEYVLLMENPLDLTEGSETLKVIQTLEDNGVIVNYEYLDITVNQVTENSIEISWLPVTKDDYEDFVYYIMLDGEEVAIDLDETAYTLSDLQPDTEYTIEIIGMSDDFERFVYGTTIVKTATEQENPENPGENPEEPGDGSAGEGKDPTDQETAPGKVTEKGSTPDKIETQTATSLPNTATNSFNLLVIGFGLVVLGFTLFVITRRKFVNR